MQLKPHALSHDIYRSVIAHFANDVAGIVEKKLDSKLFQLWSTKNPDVFKKRIIVRSYDEAPAGGTRIDAVWFLQMQEINVRTGTKKRGSPYYFAAKDEPWRYVEDYQERQHHEDWWQSHIDYYIFHEIKTGQFSVEDVVQHYLKKSIRVSINNQTTWHRIIGMNSQLWIWGYADQIAKQPTKFTKKGLVRLIPLEFIKPLAEQKLKECGLEAINELD